MPNNKSTLPPMSNLEEIVFEWLTRKNIVFEFQSQLIGGYIRSLGDAIIDFLLPNDNLLFRVMGEYFHSSTKEKARDIIQKQNLEGMGYTVVDLWEDDLLSSPDYVLEHALRGEEVSLSGDKVPLVQYRKRTGGFTSGELQTYTVPVVITNAPSGSTAQGTLTDCGAAPCMTRFEYAPSNIAASPLCYLFPWKFYALLNIYSPDISLDFLGVPASYTGFTAMETGKITGDSLTGTMILVAGQPYSVRAYAKNAQYDAYGADVIFIAS